MAALKFSSTEDLLPKLLKRISWVRSQVKKSSGLSLRCSYREAIAEKLRKNLDTTCSYVRFFDNPVDRDYLYKEISELRGSAIDKMLQTIADNYSREMAAASRLHQEELAKETPWDRELRALKYHC